MNLEFYHNKNPLTSSSIYYWAMMLYSANNELPCITLTIHLECLVTADNHLIAAVAVTTLVIQLFYIVTLLFVYLLF